MSFHQPRALILAVGSLAALVASPSESQAFFHHLFGCHSCARPVVAARPVIVARPVVAAPACSPCQPQVVRYMPQTCYRTVTVNVPVTTLRPMTTCDPCTGCPVTVMRPVTTFVRQCQRVPFTTFRPVCTTACAPTCCPTSPCGVGACAARPVMATSFVSSSPSSCCTSGAPAAMPAPVMQQQPAIMQQPSVMQQPPAGAATPQPSIPQSQYPSPGSSNSGQEQTFQRQPVDNGNGDHKHDENGASESEMQPIPQKGGSTRSGLFRAPQSYNGDRTTRSPYYGEARTASRATPIRPALHIRASQEQLDAAGWRAK